MIKNPNFTSEDLKRDMNYNPETGLFHHINGGHVADRRDEQGYVRVSLWGRQQRAHRLAWLYVHSEWPSDQIDHINGDKADNRIANLRIATNRQNAQNKPAQSNNRLGIRGVRKHPKTGRYEAWIWINGKRTFVGGFGDAQLAGEAYAAAARRHFGEFCHQSVAQEAVDGAPQEITLQNEQILGVYRFEPGRYRIVKMDGPAAAPEF
jgi:hypothetical protein